MFLTDRFNRSSSQGWPKLHWFITEHLPKPPKDWMPPPRLTDDTPAYVEVHMPFMHLLSSIIISQNLTLTQFLINFIISVHNSARRQRPWSEREPRLDARPRAHVDDLLRLHRGRDHGVRPRLQGGGGAVAQRGSGGVQRHARHIHSIRTHEGESRIDLHLDIED